MSKPSKQEMIAYLCNIYESLYPFCKEQQLPTELINKIVYSPEEVRTLVLTQRKRQSKKVSNETNDQEYENPFHIYSKDDVQKILSSNQPLSKKDLSFMYEVVYGVPYHGKGTKQDLLQKIQDFFVSQSRIMDLVKNLH